MRRLSLELVSAPPGVTVTMPGGGRVFSPAEPGRFELGRPADCAIVIGFESDEAFDEACRNGWGGRRNCGFEIDAAGQWVLSHFGHNGLIRVNDEPLDGGRVKLEPGDLVRPTRDLVFRLVESDRTMLQVPGELLDAVAEAPHDEARWNVLGDWLIEHEAPHALMAAYELKLSGGTNDPELLGEYAAMRRQRHRLDESAHQHLVWRCGYVVSCSVWLGPRDPHEQARLTRSFARPQFSALSAVALECAGTESAARLEAVLATLPATVRTVGLRFRGPVPTAALAALRTRPPRARTLQLQLGDPPGSLGPVLRAIVAAGWRELELEGTRLTHRLEELEAAVRASPDVTFVLGGAFLPGEAVAALRAPNVRWFAPRHSAALFELATGAVVPLSASDTELWRLGVTPLGGGWARAGAAEVLQSGDRLGAGPEFLFAAGPGLEEAYRAWLEARLASP